MLTQALQYAALGLRVVPVRPVMNGECSCGKGCTSVGKHPQIREWQRNATCDAKQIRLWWKQWPNANIGIATGELSNVFVVDIDGHTGEQTLQALERKHGALNTLTSVTGKGKHFYFAHPGQRILNNVKTAIGAGIDVRGEGGFVVAPPSIHANGTTYRWQNEGATIAQAPSWLLDLVVKKTKVRAEENSAMDDYEEVELIPVGERNNSLMRFAGKLRAQGCSQDEIERQLMVINTENCEEPLDEAEVSSIAASAAKYEPGVKSRLKAGISWENNPLYYFPLNIDEWCKNRQVFLMSDRQVGWYIWLLIECWKDGGSLPKNIALLHRLARAGCSLEEFDSQLDNILAQFDEGTAEDGSEIFIHRQMAEMYEEKYAAWEQKKRAGLASAEKRNQRKELSN